MDLKKTTKTNFSEANKMYPKVVYESFLLNDSQGLQPVEILDLIMDSSL